MSVRPDSCYQSRDTKSQDTLTRHEAQHESSERMSLALFIELNRRLWGVVLPTILSGLVLVGVETVSLIAVGQLNDTYAIAGVGLSIIFTNFVSLSPLTGLNSTISVLVAIAYGRCDY